MSGIKRHLNAFQGDQYLAMQVVDKVLDQLAAASGRPVFDFVDNPIGIAQSNPKATSSAPPAAQFNVAGVDGKFLIQIQNPQSGLPESANLVFAYAGAGLNPQSLPIVHNLQSSTTVNFDASSSLADYGTSTQLGYEFQNPNVTLFWRLRSSYDGVTWNKWQIYSSALTCGPVGVASGLLRTVALSVVNGAATPTTSPLTSTTGVGANQATITIAGFQVQYPKSISPATGGLVTYNAGAITPLNDNTLYYVYCLDPSYSGGAVTYFASTSNPAITSNDMLVFVGIITTPVHGGGGTGGHGGGGGPCFTENTRIITRDGIKRISEVIPEEDEVLTQRGWRKVSKVMVHDYSGLLHAMGNGEYVTPAHRFWLDRLWQQARDIWARVIFFAGQVFNLEIEGDGSDEEQCYTLANGWIAHNAFKL